MTGYWSDTRPNGQPVEAGTLCWVSDPENGEHPIYTYGRDAQEIIHKLNRQNLNAQAALASRASAGPQASVPRNGHGGERGSAPMSPPSADDIARATVDLTNPAKSGAAVATLLKTAGVDAGRLALDAFARLAEEWAKEHPEFYPHEGNKLHIARAAFAKAGGPGFVTKEILTEAFEECRVKRLLFDEPIAGNDHHAPQNDPPSNPQPVFPGESRVQLTERQRGSRFATAARGTSFRPAQGVQPRTPKYTEEQIRNMPMRKAEELIRSNDRDYHEACEYYFGQVAAGGPA
jgi:hypothetical protein